MQYKWNLIIYYIKEAKRKYFFYNIGGCDISTNNYGTNQLSIK